MVVAPAPAAMLTGVLWFEVAVASLRHLNAGGNRRRRAESDLHGHAQLLGRRFLRRLARRNGILLGQWGGGRRAPLIGWPLEGSAITVAPPRTGKGADHRAQPALPRRSGFWGLDRHHRPARRALVHRRAAPPPDGPPGAAAGPLRGGGRAQEGVPEVPSAGDRQRDLQPLRLHTGGREPRGARHQRAARRPAHPAARRCAPEQPAFLRIRPRHRRRLHGLGALQGRAGAAHPGKPSTRSCR